MIDNQKVSFLSVQTSLDSSVKRSRKFKVLEITGQEGICRDFEYTLLLISNERLTEEDFSTLLGDNLSLSIGYLTEKGETQQRKINGLVYNIKEIGLSKYPLNPEVWRYQVTLSSWLRQLRQVKDCRIFQKNSNTALSIIKDLLSELELTDTRDETTRAFPRRDYCVMYNESVYNFILRRLYNDGILWRFEFEENKHVLVFFDEHSALPEIPATHKGFSEGFREFCRQSAFVPIEACGSASFDYENAPAKVVKSPSNFKSGKLYRFEYPGMFNKRNEEEERVNRQRMSLRNDREKYRGKSSIRCLQSGRKFQFISPALPDLNNKPFLIIELALNADQNGYINRFTALPGRAQFTNPETTEHYKPLIKGSQTAFVVGGKNPANIQTDKTTNVKVRFHWDHHSPKSSEHTSAFIRSSMTSGGAKRGYLFVPNIGDEVVVSYIDSDPDKPLITGRVYSSNFQTPVSPNKAPWQSTIQANGAKGANRILFDDKKDKENLEFRAKNNMNVTVGNDLEVNVEEALTIKADSLEMIAEGNVLTGNIIATVGGNTTSIAGKSISNTTGLLITGFAGGLQNNLAGGAYANAAIGMVSNKSGGDMLFEGASIFNSTLGDVENNGKGGVQSKSLLVANTASDMIENSSGGDIKQKATLAIFTKSENVKNKFSDGVKTQALMIKNQGNTVVNEE